MQTNQTARNLQADKLQSTFWWRMYFKDGARQDKSGRPILFMDGYSKFDGYAEALNPNACFCSKVTMLYQNNYFQDCEYIDFHKRSGMMCNKMTDPLWVTLYPDRYDIPPEQFPYFPVEVRMFLNNFYQAITKGKLPKQHLIPAALKNKDDMLSRTGWSHWEQVHDYSDKLKAAGHEPGAVAAYYRREMEKLASKGKI
jgi:hypothetical protein